MIPNAYCFYPLLRFVGGGDVGGESETLYPRIKHVCSSATHLVKDAQERTKGSGLIWLALNKVPN